MTVHVISGTRSPIGKYLGSLKTVQPQLLLAEVIRKQFESIDNLKLEDIDMLITGNVVSSGESPNVGRDTLLELGIEDIPAYTLNMMCGSGLQSVINASFYAEKRNKSFIAGGVESLSRAPFTLPNDSRYTPKKLGHINIQDTNLLYHHNAQPISKYGLMHMGNTAENIVNRYNISRKECDEFALRSQERYKSAVERGRFKDEIISIEFEDKFFSVDEDPRSNTTMEKLGELSPAFDENGVLTAGNSSGLNDGAASVVLANDYLVNELELSSSIVIKDFSNTGLSPSYMGLGPAIAIKNILNNNNLTIDDIGVLEINEAFSGQMIGVLKELGIYNNENLMSKVNPNGGAIALGHPLGMSGSRLIATLKLEMENEGHKYTIASACIGGGMGIAVLLENTSV